MNKEIKTVYWSSFDFQNWRFFVAATSQGISYVGSPNTTYEDMLTWVKKRFSRINMLHEPEMLQPYIHELLQYLRKERNEFTCSIDMEGTVFQREIWQVLKQIPYGETRTYSQIAESIQKPSAVRAVAAAIGANPVLITVPCHRVIGKNGKLTGYRGGLEMKEFLLNLEMTHLS